MTDERKMVGLIAVLVVFIALMVMFFCAGCQGEQVRPVVDAVAPVLVEVLVPPQVKFWVWLAMAVLGGGGIGGVIGRKTKK